MTTHSLTLLLKRQITQKWGRFLLASGGIMIGIWAISLTTSLSLGLSGAIIKAVNSQAAAREITLYKTTTDQKSFFEISEAPELVAIGLEDLENLKSQNNNIQDISPREIMGFYLLQNSNSSCFEKFTELNRNQQGGSGNPRNSPEEEASRIECPEIQMVSNVFDYFYESNRTNWVGSTEKPQRGEIVVCYECGSLSFNSILSVNSPEEMVGKEIELEVSQAPNSLEAGETINVINPQLTGEIETTKKEKFIIKAVVDDRQANSFSGTGNLNFYVDFSYYLDALELKGGSVDRNNVGFVENIVYLKDYQDTEETLAFLRDQGYLAESIILILIQSIQAFFAVLTGVLTAFGLIALIASIFGIINVVAISVLERKKEIGILKSLGARDSDIFKIFFFESAFLGFIGWILGIVLALVSGLVITLISRLIINNDESLKNNLEGLNITEFAPSFPWWLFLSTLALSLLFTTLSGLIPSIRASRQNPVDVLRGE
jgi:ABC-type antimicrobial peptide transport system permease subunit